MASGDLVGTVSKEQFLPSADFNGTTDYIEIPHAERQLGTNLAAGFSMSAWVKLRSYGEGNFGRILDKSTNTFGANGFCWRVLNNTGQLAVGFRINGGTEKTASLGAAPTNWTHVFVQVASDGAIRISINNSISSASATNTIANITTTNNARIGNRATATDSTWDGNIAKVRMWNRVLSAAEITADYTGTLAKDGLIMNYELNGNAQDSSPFANDATVSGAYFTNVPFNNIISDTRNINLATVTDKLFVVPMFGRNAQHVVVSANRTP